MTCLTHAYFCVTYKHRKTFSLEFTFWLGRQETSGDEYLETKEQSGDREEQQKQTGQGRAPEKVTFELRPELVREELCGCLREQHSRQKEQHVKNQQPVRGHRSVCEKESALVRFMAGAQRAEQAVVQLLRDYGGLKQAKRVGLKSPGLTIQTAGESQ